MRGYKKVCLEQRVFEVRAFPNGKDHYQDFINNNFVAIGWPDIGDVSSMDIDQIRENLKKNYNDLNDESPSNKGKLTQIVTFFTKLKSMKKDDVILIPYGNGDTLTMVKVTSPYCFVKEYSDEHMAHQISIKVIKKMDRIHIENSMQSLNKSLNSRLTLTEIHDEKSKEFILKVIHTELDDVYYAEEFAEESENGMIEKYESSILNVMNSINSTSDDVVKKSLIMAALTINEAYTKNIISREVLKNIEESEKLITDIVQDNIISNLHKRYLRDNLIKKIFNNAILNQSYINLRNALAHDINSVTIEGRNIVYNIKSKKSDGRELIDIDDLLSDLKNYAANLERISELGSN